MTDQPDPALPTITEARSIEDAAERVVERRARIEVKMAIGDRQGTINFPQDDPGGYNHLLDTLGTTSPAFAAYLMTALTNAARAKGANSPSEIQMNAALAMLDGYKPANEIEAMLVAQMFASFDASMSMLAKLKQADHLPLIESYASIAAKLQRTFTAQCETLAKLRRGGEHSMRVEHVHVHEGGQAVIGNVEGGGRGKRSG